MIATLDVLSDVIAERKQQDQRYPNQQLPNGTNPSYYLQMADMQKDRVDLLARRRELTWADILTEEFYEALAEEDTARLRVELIQVAAVAVRWVEDLDR